MISRKLFVVKGLSHHQWLMFAIHWWLKG